MIDKFTQPVLTGGTIAFLVLLGINTLIGKVMDRIDANTTALVAMDKRISASEASMLSRSLLISGTREHISAANALLEQKIIEMRTLCRDDEILRRGGYRK